MSTKIKLKRNTLANIGTLDVGEPYLATDTFDLYIGTSAGNKQIAGVVVLDTRYLKLSGGTMTGNIVMTTDTYIGPTSTTGIYFKSGNVGIGTTNPGKLLSVGANLWQADVNGIQWNNGVQTTVNGSTSGTFKWSMPFQGSAYKKLVIYFNAITDAGTTVTYPTAFTQTPHIYGATGAVALLTSNTTTLTIAASVAASGVAFVEGI
jgi:hypothetical protein